MLDMCIRPRCYQGGIHVSELRQREFCSGRCFSAKAQCINLAREYTRVINKWVQASEAENCVGMRVRRPRV
jgi:hypothetical protein